MEKRDVSSRGANLLWMCRACTQRNRGGCEGEKEGGVAGTRGGRHYLNKMGSDTVPKPGSATRGTVVCGDVSRMRMAKFVLFTIQKGQ
jgi:hypothetical protein